MVEDGGPEQGVSCGKDHKANMGQGQPQSLKGEIDPVQYRRLPNLFWGLGFQKIQKNPEEARTRTLPTSVPSH